MVSGWVRIRVQKYYFSSSSQFKNRTLPNHWPLKRRTFVFEQFSKDKSVLIFGLRSACPCSAFHHEEKTWHEGL
jgi:hypothetical protein